MIFILGCISYSELTYKRKTLTYEYPSWAIGVGWSLACVSVVLIPIFIVQRILTTPGTLTEVSTTHIRDGRFVSKVGQIVPKWDKSGALI